MDFLLQQCDELDATVFGDELDDEQKRKTFSSYLKRWERRVKAVENWKQEEKPIAERL